MTERVARVVVEVEPLHLDHPFDYLVPDGLEVAPGQRVQVGFAGRSLRGLVVDVAAASDLPTERLRPLRRVLGDHVWVRPDELELLRWAATRFGAPLADVVRHALPARRVEVERRAAELGWYPPGPGVRPSSDPPPDPDQVGRAWAGYGAPGRQLVEATRRGGGSFLWRPLPDEDVGARLAELAQATLAGDRDVLVVVPDPASPIGDAVVAAAGDLAVDLRGGPSPRIAYRRWLEARCGLARVVVGERGAAFFPLDRLGLAVVVDEANPALKERRSPRHHAREVVLERARRAGAVGLLVGTVPSAAAWRLLRDRRLAPVVPDRATERRARPRVEVVTGLGQPRARLARESLRALKDAVGAGSYGVVLAARRGEGRALVCRSCGQRLACPTCDSSLAARPDGTSCEGCGWGSTGPATCRACGKREIVPLAAGAARLAEELRRAVDGTVAVLEGYAQPAPPPPAVLVMTRGSVLATAPGPVGAVVLPDLDGSLRRPTLDAAEDTLRLACTLAAWVVQDRVHADRPPGRVVVQTKDPDHHAIKALASWDHGGFWRSEAGRRAELRFPPAAFAIRLLLGAGAGDPTDELRRVLPAGDDLLGPVVEGELSGYLVKTDDRTATLAGLRPLRERWGREGVEARLDVDPVDAW